MLHQKTFDIIICGGGTAGCVLANRLSEESDYSILLIEAGQNHNDDPRVKVPGLMTQIWGDPSLDYAYVSVPQCHLGGKEMKQSRGKGLGGSSLINYMALVQPSKAGLNAWAECGNPGWDWDSMLPYLKKFHTFHMPDKQVQEALDLSYVKLEDQAIDGPVHASYSGIESLELDKIWRQTFQNMGYEMKADTMSGHSLGGYQIASVIEPTKRERSHAGVAYWEKAKDRPNLTTLTHAVVDKVLFDKDLRASSVRIMQDGIPLVIEATKEVILCAGSMGSPAILERSGIGQGDRLRSLNIDVVVENDGVGENLQDHLMAGVSYEIKEGVETVDSFADPAYVQQSLARYESDKSGPLGAGFGSFAYMPLLDQDLETSNNELAALLDKHIDDERATPAELFTKRILKDRLEASANLCLLKNQIHLEKRDPEDAFALSDSGNYVSILTALAHPLSRGNVHISSTDPTQPLIFDPGYYSHPLDLELLSRHVAVFDRITQSQPFAQVLKANGRRIPDWVDLTTDKGRKRLVKDGCYSNQHVCATCTMSPKEAGGVVDHRLNVYGTSGLRVVDASILPVISRGNIMSVTYAVAEKAADMIKQDLRRVR